MDAEWTWYAGWIFHPWWVNLVGLALLVLVLVGFWLHNRSN